MPTVLCFPNADSGPNDYTPSGAFAHALLVDENPHDGDAEYLIVAIGREVYTLDVSAIPDGSVVTSVTIRTAQKQTAAGANTYHAGLIIAGVDYFEADHVLIAGSSYIVADDIQATDPSDGAVWTKARLAAARLVHEQISIAVGLPRPRLTQCVVLADIILPPDRPTATDAAVAGAATAAAPSAPSGSAQAVAGVATAAGLVPGGTVAAVVGAATAAGPVATATAADSGPKAFPASTGPSATVTPVFPAASAQGLVPASTAAAVLPPSGQVS